MKTILNSALSKLSKTSSIEYAKEYFQQEIYLECLQKENSRYRVIFDNSYELTKNKLIIHKLSEKIIALEKEINRLNEQFMLNRRSIYFNSSISKFQGPGIVKSIYRACCLHRLEIDELNSIINPNNLPEIPIKAIQ